MEDKSSKLAQFSPEMANQVFQRACGHIEANIPDQTWLKGPWPRTRDLLRTMFSHCACWEDLAEAMESLASSIPFSHTGVTTPFGTGSADEPEFMSDGGRIPEVLKFSWKLYGDSLYLRIPSFKVKLFPWDEIIQVLRDNQDCRRLFLDLRLNDGGSLGECGRLLGLFIGPDIPYCRVSRPGHQGTVELHPLDRQQNMDHLPEIEAIFSHGETLFRTPLENPLEWNSQLFILIGERTFSSGELFAQTAMELASPIVVGGLTSGMVVPCRDDFDCGQGFGLCLPFATITTSAGTVIEGRGVFPMLAIDFNTPDYEILPGVETAAIMAMIE